MLGRRWPKPVQLRKGASLVASLILFWSAVLPYFLFHTKPVHGNQPAMIRPSMWPVFVGTRGDIEVNVTVPGLAVKIEIPREFVPVGSENDTSFVWSTITEDYWYYNVTDASQHFPYDPNAPWYVIIWSWNLTGFCPPQIVRFKNMVAPTLAGLYNVTIHVSTSLSPARKPVFPTTPTKITTMLVSGSRDWATVYGYLIDTEFLPRGIVVKTKGVVYAFNAQTRQREARALINFTTGFFNLTGLRPGSYFFEASAGYFPTTGYAYALTNQSLLMPLSERQSMYLNMTVNRGARIRGTVLYEAPPNTGIASLSHPWLTSLGYSAKGILNWTVEARSNGKLIAVDYGNTLNLPAGDPFLLVVGKRWKYVGVDPVGTEFCGIGLGTYNLTAYVFAYVQKQAVMPVQIVSKGQDASRDIHLVTGGVISGTIRFVQPYSATVVLESPRQAELRVCGTMSGRFFGGHILVEAYRISDWSLQGVFVRNGTLGSGVTIYADENTIKFHILGFNEYYNRTRSGTWRRRDYGLDQDIYNVKVRIRGYIQPRSENVTLGLGLNQTLTVNMEAGGAVATTMASGIPWPCTMKMQTSAEWIFLNASVHYRARIYYYDEKEVSRGYTESIIAPGQPGVTNVTLTATFSGMNHDLAEVIYWGQVPTVMSPGTYSLKAFTYGYVQTSWPNVYVEYYCASARIIMLIGCSVDVTGVLIRAGVFYRLVENVSYRVDLTDQSGGPVGGEIGNATIGSTSISFSCRGFGGLGHFFFVTPDGVRHYDYGFGKDGYNLYLRRFGYLHRFEETRVTFSFACLGFHAGYVWRIPLLNKIYGVVKGLRDMIPVRLSWATIEVRDLGEVSMSMDGSYWVFMPDGSSQVYCSLLGYVTASTPSAIEARGGAEIQLDFTLQPAPL